MASKWLCPGLDPVGGSGALAANHVGPLSCPEAGGLQQSPNDQVPPPASAEGTLRALLLPRNLAELLCLALCLSRNSSTALASFCTLSLKRESHHQDVLIHS